MKQRRLLIIQFLIFLFAAVTIGRLFYWQIIKHDDFTAAAKDQTQNTVTINAKRGKILARDGSILVSNQKVYLLYAILPEIKKQRVQDESQDEFIKKIADKLVPVLLQDKISLMEDPKEADRVRISEEIEVNIKSQLKQEDLVWVSLARDIGEPTREKIDSFGIKGIGFQEESKRFYPEGNIAANLLGFVGKDEAGEDRGYFGIEGYYDDKLRGKSGQLVQEVDALGRPILISSPLGRDALNGADLVTTIDRTVQFVVDNKLKEGVKRYGAKGGAIVVLDVKTGGILAMSSAPTFNLQSPAASNGDLYKNLAISQVYEPGSTFKSVTIASGLDSGSVDIKTVCPCDGPLKISGFEVQTFNNKYHPGSTIIQILQHSDNIGAAFVARKTGIDKFLGYIKSFGFGQATGLDLQGEEGGIIQERQNWGEIELATAAFGQGLSVTPLQLVGAVATVANGGALMKPYVVEKIVSSKTTIEFGQKEVRRVIKPETSSLMKELLFSAVEGGEARNLIPHGYRVGGKTGTAQVPIAGKYSGKTVASFVGFGPVEDPKFAMVVALFEPSASIYGAETAEPLFFEITKDLYPYWGIRVGQ